MTQDKSTPAPNSKQRDPRQVSEMFARVAPKYDLINRAMCFGMDKFWRKNLAKNALCIARRSGLPVLDLACGSGDVALEILRLAPDVRVVCADLCPEMLELAKKKISAAGFLKRAEFILADARRLPFESSSFSACTISFGFRNFQNRGECLAEISRVIAPGGRLSILEVAKAPKVFEPAQRFFMCACVPAIASICGAKNKADYKYLAKTTMEFPSQPELFNMLRDSNFKNPRSKYFAFGFVALTISERV